MSTPAERVANVAAAVARVSGMAVPAQRIGDLERHATARARARGVGELDAYVRLLDTDRLECEALAELMSIGETYFFRHWADFEVLRDVLLPPLFDRERAGGAPPVIWCAACSTGEEAYSVAMLVHALAETSHCVVVATDLSEPRLAIARAARYRGRSFRSVGGPLLDRCLEGAGADLQVVRRVRERVRFMRHNLCSAMLPVPLALGGVDIVIARNVLIYFSATAIVHVLSTFETALRDGGALIISSVEAGFREFGMLHAAPFESAAVFRKGGVAAEPAAASPRPEPILAARRRPGPTRRFASAAPSDSPGALVAQTLVARARRERGRGGPESLQRAMRLAAAASAREPLLPGPAIVAALAWLDLGVAEAALPFARRAASLAPDDPFAQLVFARALRGNGHEDTAALALRNAERAAAKLPPTQLVDDIEGITASVLLAAIRAERTLPA